MDDDKRTSEYVAGIVGGALAAVLCAYVWGYFALPYVGGLGRYTNRYYSAEWLARIYRPMGLAESLVTGRKVSCNQDVCGNGRIDSMMKLEFESRHPDR